MATVTGTIVVKSACGWFNDARNINIDIPVFCIPVSSAIANASRELCRNNFAADHPNTYAIHGKHKPATIIYYLWRKKLKWDTKKKWIY